LEVHAELRTQTKLFCGCRNSFGEEPNVNVCPVCLGLPGSLPVLNRTAVEYAMRIGTALHCRVQPSIFHRKNYFYPDMPKDYQISQYDIPINAEGWLDLPGGRRVRIERAHMEEDTGKSTHVGGGGRIHEATYSLVDYNRAGVPLVEIVSAPDMRGAEEARAYVDELRAILVATGASDGKMEEGSLRVDANVSVRPNGRGEFGTRCEIKNMNSISFIGDAIEYEARRQIEILEDGGAIDQETRLYDPNKGETRSMRSKEEAHDYRYFPDPDLLPLEFSEAYVAALKQQLPELPDQKKARFIAEFGLSSYDASVLVAERESAEFFETVLGKLADKARDGKLAANWVINELFGRLNKEGRDIAGSPVSAMQLAAIVDLIGEGTISGKIAKDLFEIVWQEGGDPRALVEARGMKQVTDLGAIEKVVDDIIAANPDKVAQAQAKPALIGWFVGQVMKSSGGKANPQAVNDLLKAKLGI
jgi:aspartyl-tRNA(Asn)/glutamyl-tRNA(Gln) amidotransferase subunit B